MDAGVLPSPIEEEEIAQSHLRKEGPKIIPEGREFVRRDSAEARQGRGEEHRKSKDREDVAGLLKRFRGAGAQVPCHQKFWKSGEIRLRDEVTQTIFREDQDKNNDPEG